MATKSGCDTISGPCR
ncbi:unnamed protein product, partial [Rotaria sp. Silwood1]